MNERCTLDRASATVASWFGVSVWQGEEKEWSVIFLFIHLFIYFGPDLSRRLSLESSRKSIHCPPTYRHRDDTQRCVRLCIFVCSSASTCVTLWEDERRQKGKRNAAVTSVLIIAQEMWHVCSRTLCCGAVKPQHNDPQLLVCRKLLSMGQNKVLSPYAYDSRGPPSRILAHQSLFHALQGGWIDIQAYHMLWMQIALFIMLFTDMLRDSLECGVMPIINAKQQWAVRQRQRSNTMFWSARWFMENCWTCWAFSCSSKLAFPISISLSPCPTLNQQLTTCPVQ